MRLITLSQDLLAQFDYFYVRKDYQEAAEKLEQTLRRGRRNADIYFNLAKCYEKMNKLQKATRYYGLAVGYAPNQSMYWQHYATSLKNVGNFEEASGILEYISNIKNGWKKV
ncbi:MAG: tetratricopeptide repeat protein [Chitinophagales bacterium]